jgi:hypothetical protein
MNTNFASWHGHIDCSSRSATNCTRVEICRIPFGFFSKDVLIETVFGGGSAGASPTSLLFLHPS